MKTIALLYICTGKYKAFWKDFYESSEEFFLRDLPYEKHYFVFTDAKNIKHESNPYVHLIHQDKLPWPYITLHRFKIFNKSKHLLTSMDFLFFFNANLRFINHVNEEILPNKGYKFSFLQHPGFYNKESSDFTYERNPKSLAYIKIGDGKRYYQGALNGGISKNYLDMCKQLEKNVDADLENNIIATWHDESHLNKFALKHHDEIQTLHPGFGYPEGWKIPFKTKLMSLDKSKLGGHDFLRKT